MSLETLDPKTIKPNPYNPRKDFDPGALGELAASIKELGLLQPLVVYQDGFWQHAGGDGEGGPAHIVLCGERRLLACQNLGLHEVPCIVVDPPADKAAAVQLALVENLQRADLSIAEEAPAIVELIENGMKRSAVAKALGKSIKYVGTRYSLGKYPEVLEAFVKAGGRDMETWSLVGGIEMPEIRKRIIKDFSRGYAHSNYRGDVNNVRKLEKRVSEFGAGLQERVLSSFCKTYKNPKQKIPPCCEGWSDDKNVCQFMLDLDYQVAAWLGTDHRGIFCNSESQTCLEYKREREAAELEKVKRCKKKRLFRQRYVNGDWKSMKSGRFGKVCDKCKERYKVPNEFHYERGIESPYEYCLAEDDSCCKKKREKFLASVPVSTTAELREATDERVQEAFRETLEGCEGCWRTRDCRKELDKRGYVPKLALEFEKVPDGENP